MGTTNREALDNYVNISDIGVWRRGKRMVGQKRVREEVLRTWWRFWMQGTIHQLIFIRRKFCINNPVVEELGIESCCEMRWKRMARVWRVRVKRRVSKR